MAKSKRHNAVGASTLGSVRVIAGRWRSRRVEFVDGEGLRPTPDRVRETLFNWLAADIPAARCVDLFAGTGVLGFEALSRGAGEVVAVEKNPQACTMIERNKQALGADNFSLHRGDALAWLAEATEPADILFLDPPFSAGLWQALFDALANSAAIDVDTLLYLERPSGADQPALPPGWRVLKEKTAAAVAYGLYRPG